MEVIIEPEAENDLKKHVKQEDRKYVKERLEDLSEAPTNNPDTDTIEIRGRTVFKYVMKEGSKGGKDYRAVFDIINSQIRITAIFHRDQGYDKQLISKRL